MYPHTNTDLVADLARVRIEERVRAAEARRTARRVARADSEARTVAPELTPFGRVLARGLWRVLVRRHATA